MVQPLCEVIGPLYAGHPGEQDLAKTAVLANHPPRHGTEPFREAGHGSFVSGQRSFKASGLHLVR